jgi:selenocysteine lyase/cysteine desulfurase
MRADGASYEGGRKKWGQICGFPGHKMLGPTGTGVLGEKRVLSKMRPFCMGDRIGEAKNW